MSQMYSACFLLKRAFARKMLAEDQRVNLMRPLVSVDRFEVTHVTHNRVLARDPVRAQNAASRARASQSHRHVVHLSHGDMNRLDLAVILQAPQMQAQQLRFTDFGGHLNQFLLRELKPGKRTPELYPLL